MDSSKKIFSDVFANIDGYAVSSAGRNALSKDDTKNLIYGELPFDSINEIFKIAGDKIKHCKNFYDLGSGTGKIVVSVGLILQNLSKLFGVELVPALFDAANSAKNQLSKFEPKIASKIEFLNQNFFDVDLSAKGEEADLIFLHYPIAGEGSEELYTKLEEKMQKELRQGSIIISAIRSLKNNGTFPEIIDSKRIRTNYGEVTMYFHEKR